MARLARRTIKAVSDGWFSPVKKNEMASRLTPSPKDP